MNHEEKTTHAVGAFYEKFPYPSYPLFAGLRWQEGYLGASLFAARLYEATHAGARAAVRHQPRILLAGCGEALPYVLRKMEPRAHKLTCVDLSQRSIQRAKIRLATNFRPTELFATDLKDFLLTNPTEQFSHIDSYGVLHHMPHPTDMLTLLTDRLLPHGTCRFMVYNEPARRWLRHITSSLKLLGLEAYRAEDRAIAQELLQKMQSYSPTIQERFRGMGPETFKNTARFVDTFFHAWEIRKSIPDWFKVFHQVRLAPIGIVDRYAELDDLPNPLWQSPTERDLHERGLDRRYENNLEIYCVKRGPIVNKNTRAGASRSSGTLWPLRRVTPPKQWFSYLETRSIGFMHREKIWLSHINHVHGQNAAYLDRLHKSLSLEALQRLARIGAILPGQIRDHGLRTALLHPMADSVDAPDVLERVDFARTPIAPFIQSTLNRRDKADNVKLAEQIFRRLNKSQL